MHRSLVKRLLSDWNTGARIPILCYHAVDNENIPLSVLSQQFYEHIKWIACNATPLSLDELGDTLAGTKRFSRPVVITFDDGYRSVYTNAFPILAKFRVPFVLFVITNFVGKTFRLNNREKPLLSWEEVHAMQRTGLCEVGSHTHTHITLQGTPPEIVRMEIETSINTIKIKTGATPRSFAFPKAKADSVAIRIAREYFDFVFGGEGLAGGYLNENVIPRIAMSRHYTLDKIMWLFNPVTWRMKEIRKWCSSR